MRRYDRCAYCYRFSRLTREHLIPKSKGRRTIIWACRPCNQSKANLSIKQWFERLSHRKFPIHPQKSKRKNRSKQFKLSRPRLTPSKEALDQDIDKWMGRGMSEDAQQDTQHATSILFSLGDISSILSIFA